MLLPAEQGTLVCNALAHLWSLSEDRELKRYGSAGCCPHCCGVCAVVKRLLDDGELDDTVRAAECHQWAYCFWWVGDGVDRDWLFGSWDCQNHPRCDRDPG